MTDEERQAQSLDFTYGNLAMSANHRPTREAFAQLAREKYGWPEERFDAWALNRKWRDRDPPTT
jgi:hypothetical protein